MISKDVKLRMDNFSFVTISCFYEKLFSPFLLKRKRLNNYIKKIIIDFVILAI